MSVVLSNFILINILQLYTEALKAATRDDGSLEFKRTIIANRIQSYMRAGDIHTALQDANLALSPQYTLPDSPKDITTKCLFRRAKLLYIFARYDEALLDYQELRCALGGKATPAEKDLKNAISNGLRVPEDSRLRRKDDIFRAVNVSLSSTSEIRTAN